MAINAPSPTLSARPTLAETVTARLRQEILSGELPQGTPVAEIPTAERLGVSRVPVREAMRVLAHEGLLVFGARGRAHVKSLAPGDHLEIYHARLPLERAAAHLAAERRTEEDLRALESNIAAMREAQTLAEVSLLDIDFHELIFRAARSPWLYRCWGLLRGELALWLARLHREEQSVTNRVRESTSESHEKYLALLRAKNSAAAERHIETHIRFWLEWMPLMVLFVLFCCLSTGQAANELAGGQADFFEMQVRPILAEHCLKCHGAEKQKAGLRLDSRDALLQGGESGPSIVPGDAEKSLLIQAVRQTGDVSMPPKSRLAEGEIARLAQWVQQGAAWADSPVIANKPAASPPGAAVPVPSKWWAFQPLQPVAPPVVSDTSRVRNAIDRFLEPDFEARRIQPLGPAAKRTLLRRATFDLTGLPPTPEEITVFLADSSPAAFDHMLDRLLASPRYGEHWARHWLDVARYTDYLNANNPSPQEYAEAFRYRDWVVGAFNADLPYDRFIEDQVAGDLISGTPMAATGALAIGVYDNADSDKDKIVSDIVADQIDFVGKGFLGLTLACARCHDHKFDPISQHDYYGLAGIFYSSRVLASLGDPGKAVDFLRPALEGEEYGTRYASLDAKFKSVEAQLKKMDEAGGVAVAGAPGATDLPKPAALSADEQKLVERRQNLTAQRDNLQHQLSAMATPTYILAIQEGGVPGSLFPHTQDVPVHLRGSYAHLGPVVPRGFPRVLSGETAASISRGSGRLELAHWLASPGNPLTARVMVNRLWQGHFGEGIVRTTNNFGKQGDPPSNAALLDWLASEFIQSGWSIKAMHRLIMSSAAYQRAALGDGTDEEKLRESDPENRLLARFPTRRLEAEEIRDAMLLATGNLDTAMGGPATTDLSSARRSLYIATTRKNRTNFSTLFDAADPEQSVERRDVSTVAPQALFFMNNPFVQKQAAALAKRVLAESSGDDARIDCAYELLYGHPADAREQQIGREFLARHGGPNAEAAWTDYAHVLLCANEFLTLD